MWDSIDQPAPTPSFGRGFAERSGGKSRAPRAPTPATTRVRLHETFDLDGDLGALLPQRCQLRGQPRQHERGGVRADHDDGLLRQCLHDLGGDPAADSWGEDAQPVPDTFLAGRGQRRW